jgi:hypothetical protein
MASFCPSMCSQAEKISCSKTDKERRGSEREREGERGEQ